MIKYSLLHFPGKFFLPTANSKLLKANWGCQLPFANCQQQLLIANCELPLAHTNCSLPTANCLLPVAYCQLPTAHCQLPTANCPLLLTFTRCHHIILTLTKMRIQ